MTKQNYHLPELPHRELQGFLTAIRAEPDDDTPRLIFADWLEEHGDPRAEMIRASCELARDNLTPRRKKVLEKAMEPWQPTWVSSGKWLQAWLGKNESGFSVEYIRRGLLEVSIWYDAFTTTEPEYPKLFAAASQGWVAAVDYFGDPAEIERGMSQDLRWVCSQADRLHFWVHDDLSSPTIPTQISKYHNLVIFNMVCHKMSNKDFSKLKGLPRLEEIEVGEGNYTHAGLSHLATLPSLRRLRVDRKLTEKELAVVKALPNLETLELDSYPELNIPTQT